MTLWAFGRVVLGLVALAYAAALAVVVVGAFVPRLPVVGFLGSFVTGQYPLHAALAAGVGVLVGLGVWAAGVPRTGTVLVAVATVAVVGLLVVLGAQRATATARGVTLDWGLMLTAIDQSGAYPDGEGPRTIRYSEDPPLDLDLSLPPGPGPHPVMVWAHGGSWVQGERTDRARANRWYADRGLAVVAVQYRLPDDVGGAPVGEGQRRDLACALAWVREQGPALGLDPDAVTLGGQSAGATLALSTTAALAGIPASGVADGGCATAPPAATVAFYPAVDLRRVDPSLQRAVLGGSAAGDPAGVRAASPIDLVGPGLPPTMVLLGAADNFVDAGLIRRHERMLRAAGVPGPLVEVPYADHVFDYPFGSPGAQIARPAVLEFLGEYAWSRPAPS